MTNTKSRASGKARTSSKSQAKPGSQKSQRSNRMIERKPTIATADIANQAIAEAAYFLWLERGGDDVTNWLDAEAMLKRRTVASGSL